MHSASALNDTPRWHESGQVLFWAADLVGVSVPANLLFFMASMTLLAISIQHSHELGRLEERTRVLTEEVALLAMRPSLGSRRGSPPLPNASVGTTEHQMHDVTRKPGVEDRRRCCGDSDT